MRVEDLMTRKVVSVLPRASVAEALDLMVRSHVSGLPVIDETAALVGVVSEGTFCAARNSARKNPSFIGSKICSFRGKRRKPTRARMAVTSMKL